MSDAKIADALHVHQGESAVVRLGQPLQQPVTMSVVVDPPPPKQFGEIAGPYFTGVAALLAATVALIGIAAGRKNLISQMRATVVSQNRQAWVNSLREDLAEFISEDYIIANFADADENKMDAALYKAMDQRSDLSVERKRLLRSRIELRLNPGKSSHRELLAAVADVSQATGRLHRSTVRELTRKAQVLLRHEWLRIKAEAANASPPPPLESLDFGLMFPEAAKPSGKQDIKPAETSAR